MSRETLQANAEIRVKSVNGRSAYALTNSEGKAKFVFKCGFCKKHHHLWLEAYVHPTYKEVAARYGWQVAVVEHLKTCPAAKETTDQWVAEQKMRPEKVVPHFEYLVNNMAHYFPTLFKWVDRGDGGHACNAKCMGACGKVCECRCHGRNHGGN